MRGSNGEQEMLEVFGRRSVVEREVVRTARIISFSYWPTVCSRNKDDIVRPVQLRKSHFFAHTHLILEHAEIMQFMHCTSSLGTMLVLLEIISLDLLSNYVLLNGDRLTGDFRSNPRISDLLLSSHSHDGGENV